MSSAMKFEEYLRQQAERGQFGVALIESEIALGIADWIELHRDAVPVVRCWDCMYWEPETLSSGFCGRAVEITAYKDDYCSYGEWESDEE